MHGVKRLFAWMIPRFDTSRFKVSLISLRKQDLSADTLEEFGIDVTYLARHKFDPGTQPADSTRTTGTATTGRPTFPRSPTHRRPRPPVP